MEFSKVVRAHPWITAISVLCTTGGAGLAWVFGFGALSPVRSALAGAIAGAGIACMIVATRAIGAFAEEDE